METSIVKPVEYTYASIVVTVASHFMGNTLHASEIAHNRGF
ncbi:MAG: hypothetical protein QXW18_05055 [Candidatus Bathyarchaeia archaeon]